MKRLDVEIPDAWDCKVIGFLVESTESEDLSEDMVEVQLPNGVLVSAGWWPENDPAGGYCVQVTRGLQQLIPELNPKSAQAALDDIGSLTEKFRREIVFSDPSTNTMSGFRNGAVLIPQ